MIIDIIMILKRLLKPLDILYSIDELIRKITITLCIINFMHNLF